MVSPCHATVRSTGSGRATTCGGSSPMCNMWMQRCSSATDTCYPPSNSWPPRTVLPPPRRWGKKETGVFVFGSTVDQEEFVYSGRNKKSTNCMEVFFIIFLILLEPISYLKFIPNCLLWGSKCVNLTGERRNVKLFRVTQCWGSVTFWCGSGSSDSYLWLMDPDLEPASDPDPASFFRDFKDGKKKFHSFSS